MRLSARTREIDSRVRSCFFDGISVGRGTADADSPTEEILRREAAETNKECWKRLASGFDVFCLRDGCGSLIVVIDSTDQ